MILATSLGGIAAIIFAVGFLAGSVFFSYFMLRVTVVVESTKLLVDGIREETVPLLHEVKGTVERSNRELDRVDGMLEAAGNIVQRVEKISGLVEQAASNPLIKLISLGAGLRKAAGRFGGSKQK